MQLSHARKIAETWLAQLAPVCEQVVIAGSIRREKPEVHDIEICCAPKFAAQPLATLFGDETKQVSLLDAFIVDQIQQGNLRGIKSGDRYTQVMILNDKGRDLIALDIFIVAHPAQWGSILAIRTGPSDFSRWLVTARRYGGAMPSHLKQDQGALWIVSKGDEPDELVATPTEESYFAALELGWITPQDRHAPTRKL